MKILYSAELLFAVAILMFSASLLFSGLILRRLLKLIRKGGIWVLPIIGSIALIIESIVHFIKLFGFLPSLAHAEPYDILPLLTTSMKMGTVESVMVLIAGILAFVGGFIYFRWTSR